MKIESLRIRNYKFIRELEIKQLEDACIFIGRNSVGKTAILDAILTSCGQKEVLPKHFNELSNSGVDLPIEPELMAEMFVGAMSQISRWWIKHHHEISKEDMIRKVSTAFEKMISR